MAKRVLIALAVLTVLWLACREQPKKSIPFSQEAISAQMSQISPWEEGALIEDTEPEVKLALAQPYRYLGSGGQCYTFVSEDDRYVIKFFKQKAFALPVWMHRFPLPAIIDGLKQKKKKKKEAKRDKVFQAFKLSFNSLATETGLLYLHFHPTSHLRQTLVVTDAQGIRHALSLDTLEFVVQRKAELVTARIDTLVQRGDLEGAKEAIHAIVALQASLYRKGFRNRDPNVRSNCGFIGSQAALIDVGRLVSMQEVVQRKSFQQEIAKASLHFRRYLDQYPELCAYFDDQVNNSRLKAKAF